MAACVRRGWGEWVAPCAAPNGGPSRCQVGAACAGLSTMQRAAP
jgi:hypothetical protein